MSVGAPPFEIVALQAGDDAEVATVSRWRHAAFFADWRTFDDCDADLRAWLATRAPWERMLLAQMDGRPVGTCWLIARELDARHDLTPWLAVLYVVPEARERGIGAALVDGVAEAGRAAGFARLHLYTHVAERYYARLGWEAVERFDDDGDPCTLMALTL